MKKIMIVVLVLIISATGVIFVIRSNNEKNKKAAIAKAKTDSLQKADISRIEKKLDSIDKFYRKKIDSIHYASNVISIKQFAIERKIKLLEKRNHPMNGNLETREIDLGMEVHDLLMRKWENSNHVLALIRQQRNAIHQVN